MWEASIPAFWKKIALFPRNKKVPSPTQNLIYQQARKLRMRATKLQIPLSGLSLFDPLSYLNDVL